MPPAHSILSIYQGRQEESTQPWRQHPAWEPVEGQKAEDLDVAQLPFPARRDHLQNPLGPPGFPNPGRSAYTPECVTLTIWDNWGIFYLSTPTPILLETLSIQ